MKNPRRRVGVVIPAPSFVALPRFPAANKADKCLFRLWWSRFNVSGGVSFASTSSGDHRIRSQRSACLQSGGENTLSWREIHHQSPEHILTIPDHFRLRLLAIKTSSNINHRYRWARLPANAEQATAHLRRLSFKTLVWLQPSPRGIPSVCNSGLPHGEFTAERKRSCQYPAAGIDIFDHRLPEQPAAFAGGSNPGIFIVVIYQPEPGRN